MDKKVWMDWTDSVTIIRELKETGSKRIAIHKFLAIRVYYVWMDVKSLKIHFFDCLSKFSMDVS